MKTPNEIWAWHEGRLNSMLPSKSQREPTMQVAAFNSTPRIIDCYPTQSEDPHETRLRTAKNSRLILHEARNTMTALLLTLENLTSPRNQQLPLEETIEVLQQLSNRLNRSIEKFASLFPDSNPANLEN